MKWFVLSCLIVIGIETAIVLAQSTLAGFGINENEDKKRIVNCLAYGSLSIYPNKKIFKAATSADRVAFVTMALNWAKIYCESPAFKADYDKLRASAKPIPPPSKGTPEEQFAKLQADQQKDLENLKKNMAKMSPELQKQMAIAVKQMEAGIERTSKDPQTKAMMIQGYQREIENNQKGYQERLAEYDKKYPAAPNVLIAGRLHQFLDLSKDVAFDAKLLSNGAGKMKFADPQYEAKPGNWKLCYRAGKGPVEAARSFAMDWLRQIEGK